MDEPTPPPAQWPEPSGALQPPTPPAMRYPASPPPRRGMSAGAKWAIGCGVAVVLAMIAFFMLAVAAVVAGFGGSTTASVGGPLALIRVEGPISASGASGGLFESAASSERIASQLQQASEDSAVKGILIRVDSPGGSAAASQEINQEILRVRRAGKPVFVSMGDVAASGGYYIAAAADRVFANPGTITGSIGVISANLDISALLKKIGVAPEVVKTGEFKDMGSGLRPMTARERELTSQLLSDVYAQFVDAVASGRHLPRHHVVKLADGRVFTGRQALDLKLVDELGGLRVAARALGRRVGIKGEPKLTEYRRRGLLGVLFGDVKATPPSIRSLGRGLLYDRVADLVARGAVEAEQ